MIYIYGNSILFFCEMFAPAFGYFHGLMLLLSLGMGWGSFFLIGNILKKTIYEVYKTRKGQYKVKYISFFKVKYKIKKDRERRLFKSL